VGFALRGSNVVCRYEMNEEPWPIDADEGQISQVVHNLVLNAQQAMTGGGEVLVTTRNRLIDADPDLAPGPYVEVGIRDHGGGIPTDVLPRIFDPYFTTKAGGTGLGLSTSFRIVRQHRGRLGVQVHPGSGCTFTFLLPARPGVSVPAAPHHAPRRPGRGRVLVMDDEANIRELLLAVLGKEGYDVTAVRDGTGALEEWDRARQAGVPFDIVLMDLTIPGGMGGREAVRRLKALDPGARAIVSSGYSTDPVMSRYRDEGFDGVVAKPYRLDDLLFEVERVLDRRRSGARRRRSGAVPRQP
jgi:CheY-like chemotaxis protein